MLRSGPKEVMDNIDMGAEDVQKCNDLLNVVYNSVKKDLPSLKATNLNSYINPSNFRMYGEIVVILAILEEKGLGDWNNRFRFNDSVT